MVAVKPVRHLRNQLIPVAGGGVKLLRGPLLAPVQDDVFGVHDNLEPVLVEPELAGIFVGGAEAEQHGVLPLRHKGDVVVNRPHVLVVDAALKVKEIPVGAVGAYHPRMLHRAGILGQHLETLAVEHGCGGDICKGNVGLVQHHLTDGDMTAGAVLDLNGKEAVLHFGGYLDSLRL